MSITLLCLLGVPFHMYFTVSITVYVTMYTKVLNIVYITV